MINLNKKTILLIEDEYVIAMITSKILQGMGYNVIHAETGEKAVKLAMENAEIQLILSDINLGNGIDGPEAARQILFRKHIPIVFHTSHSEKEYVDRVKKITRYGYVVKNSGNFVLQSSIEMAFELFNANETARNKEIEFETIFENTPLIMLLVDRDRKIYKANSYAAKFARINAEDMIGLGSGNALHCINSLDSELGCGFSSGCSDCIIRKTVFDSMEDASLHENIEVSIPRLINGIRTDTYYILSMKRLLVNRDKLVLLSMMDITERKRAEAQNKMLKHSLDVYTDGIYWMDNENKFVYVNQAGGKAFGCSPEDLLGKTLFDVNPTTTAETLEDLWEKLRTEGTFTAETVHRRFDGTEFYVEVRSTYLQYEGKEYNNGYARDITERKRAEEKIKSLLAEKEIILKSLQK